MVTIQSDQQLAGDNRIRYIPPETLSPNNYQKLTTFTPPNADGRIVLWSGQAGGINIMPRDSIADGGGGGVPQDLLIRWYNAGVTVVTMGATGFASGHLGGGLFREYTSDHYLVTGSHSGDGWEWFWAARDAEWAIQKVKQLIADGDLPGQPSVTYDPADIIVAGSSRAAIAFMQAALVDRAKVSGSSQVQQSTRVKAIVAFRAQCTYEAFVQNNMLYSRYFPAAGDADSGVQAANLSDVSQAWQRGASPVTQVNAAGAAVDLTPIYLSYDNAVEEEDFSVDGGGFPSLFSTIVNTHALWHGVMYAHRIKAYDAAFYDTFCRLAVKSGIELAAPNDVHHFVFPSGQTFNGQAVEDDCYQWALDRWAGVGTIDPPTDVAYTPDSATVEIGQAIPNLVPSFSGGMPSSYAVQSGSLPSGISLNPVSGVISGTPTADDGSNPGVVRATNSAGFDDAGDVTLTVNAVTAPSNLAYTPPSAIVPRGTAVSLVPSWDGGAVTTWAVSAGTLPAGLTLNASTGVISGITTTEYASAQVTIQATNAGGNDTEDITFEVLSTQDIPFLTGMNTSRVNDFTSQYPWKNFMWRSFPWRFRLPNGTIIPGHPDNGGQFVPLNAQGYPDFSDPIFADGRTAIAEVVSLQGPRYPAGIYTITYQGGQQGDVIFHKSGSQDVVGDPTLDEPGRLKQEVVPGSGANNLTVRVKGTVTGIQIWSPGHDPAEDPEPTKILHPDFVAKWQECTDPGTPFRPLVMWAVEFCGAGLYSPGMQLTRKGWDPVPGGGWPHKSPDDPSMGVNPAQQQSGASTDVIVKMANELDRDLWVNVAHRYDDLSVRRQAEYIRDNLSPTLRCVLEFENEIWNPGFPVWNYHDEIIAPQTGESLEQWAGRRISEVFAIYADVFAGQHQRLVRYVGGWRGQPSFTEDVLSYVTEQVDAAGVAPYFQPDSAQISAWAGSPPTVTDFIQHIIDRKDLVRVKLEQNRDIVDAKAAAQGSPIRHVYYEAGLALQFFHSTLQAVGKQALLHPFMQDCYLTYMALFAELGIETVVWYRFCDEVPGSLGGGAWGHTRSLTVVTGSGTDPRWDAITKHGLAQDEVTFSGYNPAGPYVWELDAEEVYLEPVTVGNIDTFSVESGTLPTGVTLDTGTGLITGTPSTTASGEMVTIRGANSVSGDFQEVVLDITVAAPTPPVGLSYSNSDQTVNIGQPIATMNPSLISGDVGVTYSIAPTSPQLPTGVTLNPSTGVISGTPTQTYADQDICVEARNVAGFDEALVQLQVVNGPPTNPSIVPNPAVAEVDEAVSIQCSAVGQGLTWTDEDALPAGLSLNASSGLITGSVSSPVAQANYTMRATNAQGFVEIELDLEIVAAAGEAPRNLTITPPGGQFPVGEPLVLQVSAQGTAPIAFTAPGGLPPGLSISELTPTTAEITGSPSTVVDADYTVRATNAFGQVDQVIHIVTAEAPPTLSYPNEGGGQLTWPINVFVSLPADATGNNLSFDIVEGTLPAGIDIRPLSGRLRGTPTEATFEQRVVVRASNAGGFAEFELFITVEQEVTPPQPPSAFSYAPAELDLTAGDAPIQLVPTISGTAPFTFEVHQGPIGENPTRLPRMLRLNASTGIITGRPTEIRDGATYRIRARNPHGFADAFIDIEVVRGREGGGPTFIRVGRPGRPRTNEPPDIIPLISDPDDLLDLLLGEDDAEEAPRR